MIDGSFASRLLAWYDVHGRRTLPWQAPRTPYRVWLSEVMLQQTQVATVVPYFERFVAVLPDLDALATAPLDRVLSLWAGLGYYSRAHNLHRAAQQCVSAHGGELPRDVETLSSLPGIGRSTAAAILAQAHGARHAILDGNVKRVLARRHAVAGDVASAAVQKTLWKHSESLLPDDRLADYTQAIMDLGATVCTRMAPACMACPVADDCRARIERRVDELPQARAKRTARRKTLALLLLVDRDRRVLVEQRPSNGIWGGLYSVPEFPDVDALVDATRPVRKIGATPRPLSAFAHAFTHYTLDAQPYVVRAAESATRSLPARETTARYLARDELDDIALPTPIRKLLQRYWETEPCPEPSTA